MLQITPSAYSDPAQSDESHKPAFCAPPLNIDMPSFLSLFWLHFFGLLVSTSYIRVRRLRTRYW
jgi:hypothetical protein